VTKIELIQRLAELDRYGIYVLAKRDIEKLFPDEDDKAMEKSLQHMVCDGLLQRVAKGLYLNPAASTKNRWIVEEIAKLLRPGCLSYVSLESILSEYGSISQIPINRLTVMTTGRSGLRKTPYGTIECLPIPSDHDQKSLNLRSHPKVGRCALLPNQQQ